MNVKVGDHIRIKSEEEIFKVAKDYHDGVYLCMSSSSYCMATASMITEVIPQTLDDYICSLSLEERAKWFVHSRYDSEYDCHRYFSIVTYDSYFNYSEALQATIEELKSPKEKNIVTELDYGSYEEALQETIEALKSPKEEE